MMRHLTMVLVFSTINNYASGTKCAPGFYGSNCSLTCSSGCIDRKCKLDRGTGSTWCTKGCKPGWYGSQCKISCQHPGDSCQKCPSECEGGFCQLGSRCVSECVDSYYGIGCFTCEPDCRVCSKHTGRCYNCTEGCPFSPCMAQDACKDQLQTTRTSLGDDKTVIPSEPKGIHWRLWVGLGLMLCILLTGLSIFAVCFRLRRRCHFIPSVQVASNSQNIDCDRRTKIHRKYPMTYQLAGPSGGHYSNINQQGRSVDQEVNPAEHLPDSDSEFDCLDTSFNDVYENV